MVCVCGRRKVREPGIRDGGWMRPMIFGRVEPTARKTWIDGLDWTELDWTGKRASTHTHTHTQRKMRILEIWNVGVGGW